MGAYVATAGVVVFLISVFLDWVSTQDDTVTGSGYETDTVIPYLAYFGVGLAAALLYAASRARGRQHRGLSLVTMAAGVAATLVSLSYIIDAPGALERGGDYSAEIGAWINAFSAEVAELRFDDAATRFRPDVVSFSSFRDVVSGIDDRVPGFGSLLADH